MEYLDHQYQWLSKLQKWEFTDLLRTAVQVAIKVGDSGGNNKVKWPRSPRALQLILAHEWEPNASLRNILQQICGRPVGDSDLSAALALIGQTRCHSVNNHFTAT